MCGVARMGRSYHERLRSMVALEYGELELEMGQGKRIVCAARHGRRKQAPTRSPSHLLIPPKAQGQWALDPLESSLILSRRIGCRLPAQRVRLRPQIAEVVRVRASDIPAARSRDVIVCFFT